MKMTTMRFRGADIPALYCPVLQVKVLLDPCATCRELNCARAGQPGRAVFLHKQVGTSARSRRGWAGRVCLPDVPGSGAGGSRKFTAAQVRAIRAAKQQGALTAHLAEQWGVHPSTIDKMCARESYQWVQ